MKKLVTMALCLSVSTLVFSQEEKNVEQLDSVMIDTKVPLARKNSGKVVVQITQEELKRNAGNSVAQVINQVSGIEINGSRSNDGLNLGYYVRGGRNRQVVIMVDGVQITDASQIANDYDLRLVPAASIASIEIVKGASSVLYGSGAATAVISITTKKASEKPFSLTAMSSVGTNRSQEDEGSYDAEEFSNYVSLNGTVNKFFYNASFSNRYVDGLSAVAAPEGEAPLEADIFNRYNGKLDLGYRFNKNVSISQYVSFGKFKSDFDNFNFTDASNRSISNELRTGGHFEWKYSKGIYVFNDAFTWIEREILSDFPSKYDSHTYTLDSYITYNFNKKLSALVGINYNTSNFNSFSVPFNETAFVQDVDEDNAKFNILDPYVNLTYISGFGLNVNAGARVNIHSVYDTHLVYNINPSYVMEVGKSNLKFLTSYSTAYITPSLYQLYDPLYGKEALIPEENTTIEGGVEFTTAKNLRLSAVYFNRNEKNYVDFVTVDPDLFIYQYSNIADEFTSSGVEVEASKRFGKKIDLTANYTNTQADERFALRIPEHKVNATAGYNLTEKWLLSMRYQFNSEREDSFYNSNTFETETITLKSYSLMDVTARFQVSQNFSAFVNVSNILNEEFQELYGYQTRGRNVRVGFMLEI